MSDATAIIDTTCHEGRASARTEVAGLGLVERTIRLADAVDCQRAVVLARPDDASLVESIREGLADDSRFPIQIDILEVEDPSLSTNIELASSALTSPEYGHDCIVYLDSSAAYSRSFVDQLRERSEPPGNMHVLEPSGFEEGRRTPRLLAANWHDWNHLAAIADDTSVDTMEALLSMARGSMNVTTASPADFEEWVEPIEDGGDADRAAERIWQGCHKPVDGPISRHLNRPISLSVSRFLAPSNVTPNHMSAFTFTVGLAATAAVAVGGFWWFLLGATLYQLSSILDGVDGELARGKYEFSVAGEWIDSLCDNFKDIFFYIALGWGAYKTVPLDIAGFDASLWLWFGGLAATGKFLSLVGYSIWLIPRGRGCPLLFDWGNDEEEEPESRTLIDEFFARLEILGKNDVVLFLAFASAVVGLLPWFLPAVAIGHNIVAFGIANRLISSETALTPEGATETTESRESII